MNTLHDPRTGPPPSARIVRLGLWALPAWAELLFYGTLTHQPPPQTQFAAWARYVTTPGFLASHTGPDTETPRDRHPTPTHCQKRLR
jgi:hypothetical protein